MKYIILNESKTIIAKFLYEQDRDYFYDMVLMEKFDDCKFIKKEKN